MSVLPGMAPPRPIPLKDRSSLVFIERGQIDVQDGTFVVIDSQGVLSLSAAQPLRRVAEDVRHPKCPALPTLSYRRLAAGASRGRRNQSCCALMRKILRELLAISVLRLGHARSNSVTWPSWRRPSAAITLLGCTCQKGSPRRFATLQESPRSTLAHARSDGLQRPAKYCLRLPYS